MVLLQIVVGLVFVMLLLSLFATSIMELLASYLSLRGKLLNKALRNMLASTDVHSSIYEDFRENSLYRQLTVNPTEANRREPSYMEAKTFQAILFDVVLKGESLDKLGERIEQLPDVDLKNVLRLLLREAENDIDQFRLKVQEWYDNVMNRASGWYKRNTQRILLVLGFSIAILFNADVLEIYQRLGSDPESLEQVLQMADAFVQRYDSENQLIPAYPAEEEYNTGIIDSLNTGVIDTAEAMQRLLNSRPGTAALGDTAVARQVQQIVKRELDNVAAPLGLGWGHVDVQQFNWQDWLFKVLGWTVTALSITLGAPFWFDLLKRLVNIRGSGTPPGK